MIRIFCDDLRRQSISLGQNSKKKEESYGYGVQSLLENLH